ncbi:hypothetical protein C474_01811 [Halogeometricum pallidum JCM 14848]|uniref:DUF8124 domain-containing protein n=1 Tax=Halogeometricum pallidum JCM 14848 TaxID=1227487 RepID=M0DI55_HALPD|nr:hypothetical protein [Halogeometricum pallidum]ELZ34402.1 hypothetical protein C474_01811 [Halogeometricum pallidum JCM 14848]
MSDSDRHADDDADTDASPNGDSGAGDTFGVGIHVTEADLQFVVHVPSDIDSGWTDPEEFQRLVEEAVWERLDRERTLRAIAAETPDGETVTLGRVTLRPDGTVVDADLAATGGA